MKFCALVFIFVLCALSCLCADEQLDRALEGLFEDAPFPLLYWIESFETNSYYQTGAESTEYFSPFKISSDGGVEYAIARTRLISRGKQYFWYVPSVSPPDISIESASGSEVIQVEGKNSVGWEGESQQPFDRAVQFTFEYRSLESQYVPALPLMGIGAGILSGGLAYLAYVAMDSTVFNPITITFGSLSALNLGLAVITAIQNPIVRNKMNTILDRIGNIWD